MGVVLPQPIQFGKYTLFERIGRGGMADVFKGRVQGPAGFERVFVIKRILPHLSDDPQFTRMFIEEAKLSSRLNHPNVVQVFELGAVDKEYFIAMEYVRGRDLAETMRTLWARVGPPRPDLVAYVGREMCRALAYAHDLTDDDGALVGIIHRDVSPSNVMLSYEGAVKLLDFGIAKALGGDSKDEGGTQRGTLKGKFAYMAPEQTTGNDVDRRIDIFATGIVLHEVLTGRRLFKGENDLQTVERVRQCEVMPPSMQNPLCPPELDGIVLRALARDRSQRFQTASDMADALDDVVHAARFQPTHLAQLMRDLFPTEAGGRVTASMSGSQSRPHSAGMRSPTIPPLSVSRSQPTRPSMPFVDPAPQPRARRSFFARGSTWGALALIGVGVGVGVVASRSATTPQTVAGGATPAPEAQVRKFQVAIRSIPEGAEIWLQGEKRMLGKTDAYLEFETSSDTHTSLVFKKAGYYDETREVSPYPMLIFLKPVKEGLSPPTPEDKPHGTLEHPSGPAPSPIVATPTPAHATSPGAAHAAASPGPAHATSPGAAHATASPGAAHTTAPTTSPPAGAGASSPSSPQPASAAPGGRGRARKALKPNDLVDPF